MRKATPDYYVERVSGGTNVGLSLTRDFFVGGSTLYDLLAWGGRSERDAEWLVTGPLGMGSGEIKGRAALIYFAELHWMLEVANVELSRDVKRPTKLYELYNSTTSHIVF